MLEWLISYTSTQTFELDDASQAADALAEFADWDIEVDAEVDEPPFELRIADKAMTDLRVEGTTVHRQISCSIAVKVTDVDAFNELLEDEDWYDPSDGEYELASALNYWICDTTAAPDWAEFSRESVDFDVTRITS